MKRIVVIVLMMAACLGNAQAQLHLKTNVQNNHLWRGMEVSDGIVLLTDFELYDGQRPRYRGTLGWLQLGRLLQGV